MWLNSSMTTSTHRPTNLRSKVRRSRTRDCHRLINWRVANDSIETVSTGVLICQLRGLHKCPTTTPSPSKSTEWPCIRTGWTSACHNQNCSPRLAETTQIPPCNSRLKLMYPRAQLEMQPLPQNSKNWPLLWERVCHQNWATKEAVEAAPFWQKTNRWLNSLTRRT